MSASASWKQTTITHSREFIDLRGKRIALAQTGGQFRSFLGVAEHFALKKSDFRFVGEDDQSADQALIDGKADAAFRVRALGNSSIQRLVRSGQVRLVEVGQAAAMKIRWIAFEPSVIPMGAYLGNPPIPERDLATVAVKRTLVAHRDVPASVIQAITETFMERSQKNRADHYIHRAVQLMNQAHHCGDALGLEELRHGLFDILTEAVGALDQDHLSEESFQSFRGVWEIARDMIRERSRSLATDDGTAKSEHPQV